MPLHRFDQPFQLSHRNLRLQDQPRKLTCLVAEGAADGRQIGAGKPQLGTGQAQASRLLCKVAAMAKAARAVIELRRFLLVIANVLLVSLFRACLQEYLTAICSEGVVNPF